MKRIHFYLAMTVAVMILAMPAWAGSRRYVQTLLEDWESFAEDEGYDVFYTDIDRITASENISYSFDLEPGYYYFVAEGGEDTEDIDMYVYGRNGSELASDTLDDNYPICEFELTRAETVEVEIEAYSFLGRENEDYFCFVAAGEYYGRETDSSGEASDVSEIEQYWIDWADDSGYEVLYSGSGEIINEISEYHNFRLDSGYYHVYAESLGEGEDIDMYVYGEDAMEITSDTLEDNYPICSFELRRPENVSIEIMPYSGGRTINYAIVIATEDGGEIIEDQNNGNYGSVSNFPTDENEYIQARMDDYMQMVIDKGYRMIYDQIDYIDEGEVASFAITLGRGDYRVYAEGGLGVADLDLRVYNDRGRLVVEDTLVDNYPVCEFSTRESASFTIEIESYEFVRGYDSAMYLVFVVRE